MPDYITREEARDLIDEMITERFQGVGINDSDAEHKTISVLNFTFLNALRIARDERNLSIKKSIRSILTVSAQNAVWVGLCAAAVWVWSFIHSGGSHK